MIGSINDKYGTQARAYRTGERVSIEYLNGYLTITKLVGADSPDTERTYLDAKGIECRERQRENEWIFGNGREL